MHTIQVSLSNSSPHYEGLEIEEKLSKKVVVKYRTVHFDHRVAFLTRHIIGEGGGGGGTQYLDAEQH